VNNDCPNCEPCPECNGGTAVLAHESDETAECSCAFEEPCGVCKQPARIIKE